MVFSPLVSPPLLSSRLLLQHGTTPSGPPGRNLTSWKHPSSCACGKKGLGTHGTSFCLLASCSSRGLRLVLNRQHSRIKLGKFERAQIKSPLILVTVRHLPKWALFQDLELLHLALIKRPSLQLYYVAQEAVDILETDSPAWSWAQVPCPTFRMPRHFTPWTTLRPGSSVACCIGHPGLCREQRRCAKLGPLVWALNFFFLL